MLRLPLFAISPPFICHSSFTASAALSCLHWQGWLLRGMHLPILARPRSQTTHRVARTSAQTLGTNGHRALGGEVFRREVSSRHCPASKDTPVIDLVDLCFDRRLPFPQEYNGRTGVRVRTAKWKEASVVVKQADADRAKREKAPREAMEDIQHEASVMRWLALRCRRSDLLLPLLGTLSCHAGPMNLDTGGEVKPAAAICGLVVPRCVGGSLASWRPDDKAFLARMRAFRGVAAALAVMHEVGAVHGDVKPDNALLRAVGIEEDGSDLRIVLSDFGTSTVPEAGAKMNDEIHVDSPSQRHSRGSLLWMAPELFGGGRSSKASDLYALAMVGFFLLEGRQMHQGLLAPGIPGALSRDEFAVQVQRGLRPQLSDSVRAQFANSPFLAQWWTLLCSLWNQDSEHRPSAAWVVSSLDRMVEEAAVLGSSATGSAPLSICIESGLALLQGNRASMEDAAVTGTITVGAEGGQGGKGQEEFVLQVAAVLDGHNSARVAAGGSAALLRVLQAEAHALKATVVEAGRGALAVRAGDAAIRAIDGEWRSGQLLNGDSEGAGLPGEEEGATCTLVLVGQERDGTVFLSCSWVGDSAAFAFSAAGDGALCRALTPRLHRPGEAEERRRIELVEGGAVRGQLRELDSGEVEEFGVLRVFQGSGGRGLAVSRAIGDMAWYPSVCCEPESSLLPLVNPRIKQACELQLGTTEGELDIRRGVFVVVASDGVFESMPPEEVASFVRSAYTKAAALDEIGQSLVREAVRRGSSDNCASVVMHLRLPSRQ